MLINKKGRTEATPKSNCKQHYSLIQTRVKATLVKLTLWGLLPIPVAEWLIRHLDASSMGGASS